VARQQAATWFLIIFRLAVMMQTPEAHFIDCNTATLKSTETQTNLILGPTKHY
jgi:hypothetical protein